ncbi:hypothetical protein AGMMS49944_09010 [Spirochaetia bacterium]|nr:hypothetical protein AGMMS49944_09010 [Spirochaetia bacterium]
MLNKDTLLAGVLAASGGKQVIKYDIAGKPSVMVRIPRFNLEDISPDLGTGPHPAFVVGGVVKDEIFIGAYQAVVDEGKACSLPGVSPTVNINFDNAKKACTDKGPGWHLMTNWEWAAVALWALKNGFQPRGNTASGKAYEAGYETGTPAPDNALKTLAGTGPNSWRHDNGPFGIADLVGNISEWQDGLKIVDKVIFMPDDNNYALAESAWPKPAGDQVVLGAQVASEGGWRGMTTTFGSLSDDIKKKLASAMVVPNIVSGNTPLAIFSQDGNAVHGAFYITDTGEMLPFRGGSWDAGAVAGLAYLHLYYVRSIVRAIIGLRPAFIA